MSTMDSLARRIATLAGTALVTVLLQPCLGQTANVLTQHNDLTRDGANSNETILTTSNVNINSFGQLFSLPVDGLIFAQPLYVSGVTIPGQGTHNIVYVATEHDSVYAFDADSRRVYWHVSLGTPAPSSVVGSPALGPEFGITGTPVIDPSSGTLYAAAETYVGGVQLYYLHALDITTGAEKFGGPVKIEASAPGTGWDSAGGQVPFITSEELQRPAVTLVNGIVYLAFGSHDDIFPYHGWLLGYDATTLQQVSVFNVTPDSNEGSIWMAGQGLVADSSNNLYLITANSLQGTEDAAEDYGESFLKLVPSGSSLTVGDYFKPNNYDTLNAEDADLGAGGAFAIPGTSLIVGGGKQGLIYVVDTTNMGKLDTSKDQVFQEFQAEQGLWGSPAFFNNFMYVWGINDSLRSYEFYPPGKFFYTATQSDYVTVAGQTSGAVSISANGTNAGTAIVWATAPAADPSSPVFAVPGILFAYDATNLQNLLWSTLQNPTRDGFGNWGKFVSPTIANGKVYVATASKTVAVYGLLSETVQLGSLAQTYTGAPLAATAATTPSGLAVTFTYTGANGTVYPTSSTPPTDAGSYTVVATISDPHYNGTDTGTLVIDQAAQTINFTQPATPVTYAPGEKISLSAIGGASGNAVVFSLDAASTGTATISGGTATVTRAGTLLLDANQADNQN